MSILLDRSLRSRGRRGHGAAAPQRLPIEFRTPADRSTQLRHESVDKWKRPPGTAGANAALPGKVSSPGEWPCSRAHPFIFRRRGSGPLQAIEGGGDVSRQILHFVCAPSMRSPNGGRYALRIFPIRDLIRTCVSLRNAQGVVVDYR